MKKEEYYHTYAPINLKALDYNVRQIRKIISAEVKILATVKANAYGHGIVETSKFLKNKVDYLGVAYIEEGVLIRRQGIKTPVLILGNTLKNGFVKALNHNLQITLTDIKSALHLNKLAAEKNKRAPIHIKVDTGMGRIGFWHKDALRYIRQISKLEHVKIEGLYTHLSSVEKDCKFSLKQIKRFNRVIKEVEAAGIKIKIYHAANSLATLHHIESHFNLVRPGIILYGVYPDASSKRVINVKPALSLKTKVVYIKEITAGRSISYNRSFISKKKMKIATLPIGYADGYSHLLTHKAQVLIKGKKFKVVGKICMDQIMVDVSPLKSIKIGDEVTLIGKSKNKEISVEELAKKAATIPYELLCNIGNRVKRIYEP
jgi:alanine racemase